MIVARRRFLFGAGAVLLAAPAIVRASSLMPMSVPKAEGLTLDKILGFKRVLEMNGIHPGDLIRVNESWYRALMTASAGATLRL